MIQLGVRIQCVRVGVASEGFLAEVRLGMTHMQHLSLCVEWAHSRALLRNHMGHWRQARGHYGGVYVMVS
jgi:hypothetical protein